MDFQLSRLVENLSDSATLAVAEAARQLKARGIDVIAFGAGEPDFDTPPHIVAAAIDALHKGDTRTPAPISGKEPLRRAICDYTQRFCGVEYRPEQICVTSGGKDALHLALASLLNPGDEVVIPVPYWVSYPEQVRMFGGTVVPVPGDPARGGKLAPLRLAAALTPRTRVFVLNSPSNPAGFTYSRDELAALADVLRGRGVLTFSDEIYHRLYFGHEPVASFAALPGMYDDTVTFNSASKTFAMTGWRLGYAAGPEKLIRAMTRIQSQTTNGPASFVQTAMIAALTGDQTCVQHMCDAYRRRAAIMHDGLNAIPGVACVRPTGAFYTFPDVSATFARLGVRDANGFAQLALENAHVALVAGNAFGQNTHVRLSYATSEDAIREGLRRLTAWLVVQGE